MKRNLLLLSMLLFGIIACNGTSSNLRPRTTTHDAVHANINLGMEYMRQGNYEKALEILERARMIDPGYFDTYNMLGIFYQTIGDNNEAERNFKRALSLSHNSPGILNNYGQLLYAMDKCDKAIDLFMEAAGNPLYDTPEIPYYNAGRCALKQGNATRAEQYLRKSLEINPTLPASLIAMSEVSFENKNYLSARGYLQRYMEVSENTPRSLWLGIQIENELGDKNAVSSYALLLRNNFPTSKEAALMEQAGIR